MDNAFLDTFGPMFWAILVALTVVMVVVGLWLGKIIGARTNSGIGAFFIHLIVTLSLTGGVLPIIVLVSLGQASLLYQAPDPDFLMADDEVLDLAAQMLKLVGISSITMIAYFIAGLIGIAKGRN